MTTLHGHQRREQTDRTGAGDKHGAAAPSETARADPLDMIPRLGDHARRLGEHREQSKIAIHFHRECRIEQEMLGPEAVTLLDAALGVAAVAAHIPFADRAGRTRHRIRPAHHADHPVARRKTALRRRALDHAEGLMADHQPVMAGRRGTVMPGEDFPVGSADTKCQRTDQQAIPGRSWGGDVIEAQGTGRTGRNRECLHSTAS